MKKRIIFSGGLGNQMFEYALYRELCYKGMDVEIDLSLYDYVKMHNGYELDRIFQIDHTNETRISNRQLHILFLRILLKFKPSFTIFDENSTFHELKRLEQYPGRYFHGYWQSESYFPNVIDEIRKLFVFQNIDYKNQQKTIQIQRNNSVSLHIRRGDYVGHDLYANCCTEEYYKKAIQHIIEHVKDPFFYIFSNDPPWAEKFIKSFHVKHEVVVFNQGEKSYQDMFLMSKCKHNIIANSSFSWWGAWLNSHPFKIVIAPRKWYQDQTIDYSHIVPDSWIKM